MNEIKTNKCIICKNLYDYNTEIGTRNKVSRSRKSPTCSKECSKTLQRVRIYLRSKI